MSHPARLIRTLFASLGIALTLGLCARGAPAASFPAMYITFQANHTFAVTLTDGTVVATASGAPAPILAGTYQLFLNDASGAIMQLDLAGPGVALVTNMTNSEDLAASYVETFQPSSTYTLRDDYQQSSPVWTFATTAASLSTGSTSSSTVTTTTVAGSTTSGGKSPVKPATASPGDIVGSGVKQDPLRGTLLATVNASAQLSLTDNGKGVSTLKSGRYRISVTDRSSKGGFTIQEIRKPATAVSGTAFVGKRSTTIDLKPGQWFFYPTFVGKKTYFIVVAASP